MKKGFTLVEIILSIALITVVGIGATIGFIQYNKNSKEKTLNNMSNEILTALRVYIETDSEAKKRIYEDYEGMAITLNTLESEGLIDFGDLDVQDDYVVAMLSNESDCSDITTVESWDLNNGPLYICSKSNGSQNLFAVGGDAENLSQATREPYYFVGTEPKNFIQLNGTGTKYRILSIERDDSLILYHTSSFGSTFNGKTQSISRTTSYCTDYFCNIGEHPTVRTVASFSTFSTSTSQLEIDCYDILKTSVCNNGKNYFSTEAIAPEFERWLTFNIEHDNAGTFSNPKHYYTLEPSGYKIHLKPCMKITGGTGDYATPFKLEAKNC